VQIGPYWIVEEIGRGAAGIVFRATGPHGVVALKILSGHSQTAWARFQREVQLQSELTGAGGFVPVLDAGMSPRGPYLVMPFFSGGTLRDRLRRAPQGFPLTELFDLGEALASAIGRAHALGLVHRDLKPENVLFDHLGCPQIADLGLAKAMDASDPGSASGLSKTGELRGTLGYMPPEQIEDSKRASASSDVFALGAILYECATGVPAFSGQGALEVMDAIRSGSYQDPRSLRPELPKPLASLIARSLSTNPEARPPDGEAFSEALTTVGLGQSSSERGSLGGGILLALAVGAGVVLLGYQAVLSDSSPDLSAASPSASDPPSRESPSAPARTPARGRSLPPTPSSSPTPTSSGPRPRESSRPESSSTPVTKRGRVRVKRALAQRLDELQSIAVAEQLGSGRHRGTAPLRALFLIKEGTQLAAWGEDHLWVFSFPELKPLRNVRLAFASADVARAPDCVRVLSPDGGTFLMSTPQGAFLHSQGKGLRIEMEHELGAAVVLSTPAIAALADGVRVSLISTETRKGRGALLHKEKVVALAGAAKSNRLLTVTEGGNVHAWELGAGPKGNLHKGRVGTLEGAKLAAMGPAGDLWAAASAKQIRLGSVSGKAKPLNVNLSEKEGGLTSIRISDDGELLSVHTERQITTVRITTREVESRTTIPAATASIVDRSGKHMAYVARNSPQFLRAFNGETKKAFKADFGHVGAITAVAPAPEGLVAGDASGGHSYWKRGRGRYIRLTPGPITGIASLGQRTVLARRSAPSTEVKLDDGLPTGDQGATRFAAWGPQRTAILGEENGLVRLLGQEPKTLQRWKLHTGAVLGAKVLPKGLVSWGAGEGRLLLSFEGRVTKSLDEVVTEDVVAVTPLRGGALAVGLRSGEVRVFDASKGGVLTTLHGSKAELTCLAGHPSGRLLLVGDRSSAVRVFVWSESELTLLEEVKLGKVRDMLTYAGQGRTLDDLYLGTARGILVHARWQPAKIR
jgi:serine/threonine protein kinase/WD40 repeat protein